MVAGIVLASSVAPRKTTEEMQEVLQHMSLNDDRAGAPGDCGMMKRSRTREVASRYKAATFSSANAAAITAQRYQSPNKARSPSPNLGRSNPLIPEASVTKRALSAERRPISVERRRPWPSFAAENKTPNSAVNLSKSLSSRKLRVRGLEGSWHSANSLSSSVQSDASNSSSNGAVESNLEQQTDEAVDHMLKPTQNGAHKAFNSAAAKGPERKGTPERRRSPSLLRQPASELGENSKPLENFSSKIDQRRWPGSISTKALISRSVDFSVEKKRSDNPLLVASYTSKLKVDKSVAIHGNSCQSGSEGSNCNPVVHEPREIVSCERASESNSLADSPEEEMSRWEVGESLPNSVESAQNGSLMHASSMDDNGSDTESTSSGGLSVASGGSDRGGGRTIAARFWQDNLKPSRSNKSADEREMARRLKSPNTNGHTVITIHSRPSSTAQSPLSPTTIARSIQGLSPSRCRTSPTKTRGSPAKTRGSPTKTRARTVQPPPPLTLNGRQSNGPGLLHLHLDGRHRRKGLSLQDEAHDLRLLHNRWMQWCFVNARAEMFRHTQVAAAEGLLYNVFLEICQMSMLVTEKQAQRNKIRQALKLDSVLNSHAIQLEQCESLLSEHLCTLTGVMRALDMSVIRVPVIGVPKIEIKVMNEVLLSAIDILNTLDVSVSKFLPKVEVADSLLSELAKTVVLEKAYLDECAELLAAASSLEMEERSLRMFLIQQEEEKFSLLGRKRTANSNSILVR